MGWGVAGAECRGEREPVSYARVVEFRLGVTEVYLLPLYYLFVNHFVVVDCSNPEICWGVDYSVRVCS
jgi:hypothetical protein